jgi:hypothetical protein
MSLFRKSKPRPDPDWQQIIETTMGNLHPRRKMTRARADIIEAALTAVEAMPTVEDKIDAVELVFDSYTDHEAMWKMPGAHAYA